MSDSKEEEGCSHKEVVEGATLLVGGCLKKVVAILAAMNPDIEVTLVVTHKECSNGVGIIVANEGCAVRAALALIQSYGEVSDAVTKAKEEFKSKKPTSEAN